MTNIKQLENIILSLLEIFKWFKIVSHVGIRK